MLLAKDEMYEVDLKNPVGMNHTIKPSSIRGFLEPEHWLGDLVLDCDIFLSPLPDVAPSYDLSPREPQARSVRQYSVTMS